MTWGPVGRVREALAPNTLGVAMHTCSPNTGRVKSSRSSSVTQGTPGDTVSKIKQTKQKRKKKVAAFRAEVGESRGQGGE